MRYAIPLTIALTLILTGCGTPDTANVPDGTREIADDLTTGDAGSSTATTDVSSQIGGAYMGDSAQTSVDTRAQRSATNSNSGHIQKGFDFGGAITSQALADRVASDPVIMQLKAEVEAERASENPDTDRIDTLLATMAARLDKMGEEAIQMGGDLSSLTSLTVVNTLQQHTGSGMPPLTDADAEASKMFPQVVEAAAKAIKQ